VSPQSEQEQADQDQRDAITHKNYQGELPGGNIQIIDEDYFYPAHHLIATASIQSSSGYDKHKSEQDHQRRNRKNLG
jgi:hypothetical protein